MEQILTNLRLAVLLDAENVPHNCIKSVLEEVAVYGTSTIKRIYGDWTNHSLDRWKTHLLENAITPIQQYSYTQGKNSSDSAMIIDAMDILYSDRTDGFVIVSSDSDFTRLAIRLREAGQYVMGIGERKTPKAFITACDKFTYIEVIRDRYNAEQAEEIADEAPAKKTTAKTSKTKAKEEKTETEAAPSAETAKGAKKAAPQPVPRDAAQEKQKTPKLPKDVIKLIADSIADLIEDDDDSVFLGALGNLVRRKKPDFDYRHYGYKSFSALVKASDRFDVDFRQTSDPNIKHPYVKDKQA